MSKSLNLIRTKGLSLSEINPGSEEYALSVSDSLDVLQLLFEEQTGVLGGDIISRNAGEGLIYAYQLWGDQYIYLNWYCERVESESRVEFITRSIDMAKLSINRADEVARKLGKSCFVVLVVEKL